MNTSHLFLLLWSFGFRNVEKITSSSLKISTKSRKLLRQKGYCTKLCGIGYDNEADGFDGIRRNYLDNKAKVEYGMFWYASSGNHEIFDIEDSEVADLNHHDKVLKILNAYCEQAEIPFDDCLDFEKSFIIKFKALECIEYCMQELEEKDLQPKFEEMAPPRQEFEKCLNDFGPEDIFDYHENNLPNVEDMVRTLRKNGFITVRNFYPKHFMEQVSQAMLEWDDTGEWNNLNFVDFYTLREGQLDNYENRLEIAIPHVYPFDSVFHSLHNSTLMNVMKEYSHNKSIVMEFPSSILSRPGARPQNIHGDHPIENGMLKVSIAIHDIYDINGPTNYCPCTHKYGSTHEMLDLECISTFNLDFIPAGTITIYDQAIKHRGGENKGDSRRYILDISYNIEQGYTNYEMNYPDLAQEHVFMYREDFGSM